MLTFFMPFYIATTGLHTKVHVDGQAVVESDA